LLIDDPAMKQSKIYYKPEFYDKQGFNAKQCKRIEEANEKMIKSIFLAK
jgi:hypothetical protein